MTPTIIDAALSELAPHLLTLYPPAVREILETLHDSAQDELLSDLIDSAQAASLWQVSERHARRTIAELHTRYGYGALLGGTWVIRRAHAASHQPRPVGRPRPKPAGAVPGAAEGDTRMNKEPGYWWVWRDAKPTLSQLKAWSAEAAVERLLPFQEFHDDDPHVGFERYVWMAGPFKFRTTGTSAWIPLVQLLPSDFVLSADLF